jgi:hypothetical protein
MGSGPGSPLEQAINAAGSFVENVVSENCQVGVVGFSDGARTFHPISSSKTAIIAALQSIPPGGGTDISRGLNEALTALEEVPDGPTNLTRVVVLLSDGGSDPESALQAAQNLKDHGLRIITIAFGAHADEELLRQIASSDRDYYQALDAAELTRLYEAIGTSLNTVHGYRGFLDEFVASDRFLLSATGRPAPFESHCNEGTIKWFLPFVRVPAQNIPYQITPMRAGWYRITGAPATIEMVDKDGLSVRGRSNASPHLLVLPSAWWPGLALLFNPIFWMLWSLLRRKLKPYKLVPAPTRTTLALPEAEAVMPALRRTAAAAVLKPALIIGVGYTGSLVIRALRYHLAQMLPQPSASIRFLWIDTGPNSQDDLQASPPFGEPIPEEDRILMPENLQPIFQNLRRAASAPVHLAWLDVERSRRSLVAQDYDLSRGTLRRRIMGRLALYQHLESGSHAPLCTAIDERLLSLGSHYRVFVTGHMGGGTAGGMILDLLILLQKRIQELKQDVASVDGLLFTHRMLDDSGVDPILLRNTLAFATELSRLSIRRHLPLRVTQNPLESGSPPEIKSMLDNLLLLEHPLEPPSDRTQWPGPVTHSAAELLLHLLLNQARNVTAFLDDQLGERRSLERSMGHSVICAAGATSRWLPVLQIRRLLTARTILDFLSRDLMPIERIGEVLAPARDPEAPRVAREDAAALLEGTGLTRPRPALISSLPALADLSSSPTELARIISRMHTYPGSDDGISSEVGGSKVLAELLDVQQELFAASIEEWALRIFYGDQRSDGSFDPALRRGAFSRIAASIEYLEALSDTCLKHLDAQQESAAKRGDLQRFEFVRYLFRRYRGVISGFRRHVSIWSTSLVTLTDQIDKEAFAARQQLQSLLDELQPYVIWSEEIEQRLLARYGDPVREKLLNHVIWNAQATANGAVRLTLRVRGEDDDRFDGHHDDVPSLRQALEELVPSLELDCGLDLYREDVSQYLDLKRWLLADRADPVNLDNNVQATLAGRQFVRRDVALLGAEETVTSNQLLDVITADYPYRASVVRLISGCSLFAASALHDYQRNFPDEHHVDLPFLDPIDRLAAAYEDRFLDRGLTAPMLCPAIRAYFTDHELFRAFAFAHALGLLRTRIGVERETLFLNDIQLTHEKLEGGYPVLMEALDNFVILRRSVEGLSIDRAAVRSDFINLVELFLDLELQRRQEAAGAN